MKAKKTYKRGGKMTPMQKKVVKRVHTSRMSKENEDYRKALDAGEAMPPFAGGKPKSMTDKQDKIAAKREMEKKKSLKYNKGGKFPDLNKDGKITKADVLMGRGVGRKGKKTVAQGADKADVRAERKMARKAKRTKR